MVQERGELAEMEERKAMQLMRSVQVGPVHIPDSLPTSASASASLQVCSGVLRCHPGLNLSYPFVMTRFRM